MTKIERINRREANATNTLAFIKKHWKDHGFGPAYRDIETNVGISAGSAVISVATLAERGLISVEPGVARSIRPAPRKKGS
jgi:SOS-response transcriptional repressor LexA